MDRKLIALMSVTSGMLASQIHGFVYMQGHLIYPPASYFAQSALPWKVPSYLVHFFIIFALGSFVGSSVSWFMKSSQATHKPFVIAVGSLAGFILGTLFSGKMLTMIPDNFFVRIILKFSVFGFAFAGAYTALMVKTQKPKTHLGSFASFAIGMMIFVAPLALTWPKEATFNFQEAMEETNFLKRADVLNIRKDAVGFLHQSEEVRRQFGGELRIKPDGKILLRIVDDRLTEGEFPFRVSGSLGEGEAHVAFRDVSGERRMFSGILKRDGEVTSLKEGIYRKVEFSKSEALPIKEEKTFPY